jgi:hypothetical protein
MQKCSLSAYRPPRNIDQCRYNFQVALSKHPNINVDIENLILGIGFNELLEAIKQKTNLRKT